MVHFAPAIGVNAKRRQIVLFKISLVNAFAKKAF